MKSRIGNYVSVNFTRWVLIGLLGAGLCWLGACGPTPSSVLRGNDGEILDVASIDAILGDAELTEDEKRQGLLDLGVPASLADTLLRAI